MAMKRINGVCISGLVTAAPRNENRIKDEAHFFDGNMARFERLKMTIGLDRRRAVTGDMEASGTDPATLDGAEIFKFSLKVEPKAILDMLAATGWESESPDGYIFHQANRYIIDKIRRRLKLPADRVPPGTAEHFGNQSTSIPATLTDHFGDQLSRFTHRFILSGFGVGLSWATAAVELPELACNTMVEI